MTLLTPTAVMLDRASRMIRNDWEAAPGGRTAPTMLAVADWLADVAAAADGDDGSPPRPAEVLRAIAVARAYLKGGS